MLPHNHNQYQHCCQPIVHQIASPMMFPMANTSQIMHQYGHNNPISVYQTAEKLPIQTQFGYNHPMSFHQTAENAVSHPQFLCPPILHHDNTQMVAVHQNTLPVTGQMHHYQSQQKHDNAQMVAVHQNTLPVTGQMHQYQQKHDNAQMVAVQHMTGMSQMHRFESRQNHQQSRYRTKPQSARSRFKVNRDKQSQPKNFTNRERHQLDNVDGQTNTRSEVSGQEKNPRRKRKYKAAAEIKRLQNRLNKLQRLQTKIGDDSTKLMPEQTTPNKRNHLVDYSEDSTDSQSSNSFVAAA